MRLGPEFRGQLKGAFLGLEDFPVRIRHRAGVAGPLGEAPLHLFFGAVTVDEKSAGSEGLGQSPDLVALGAAAVGAIQYHLRVPAAKRRGPLQQGLVGAPGKFLL